MCLKYWVFVEVNNNTAVFRDVIRCSLAEETTCRHVPQYSSLKYVIPFPEVVNLRTFSLMECVLCSRNNSNYSGSCLNYLLSILRLYPSNSEKPKYLAQYSDYTVRRTAKESRFNAPEG
jgi:hypothetical protein